MQFTAQAAFKTPLKHFLKAKPPLEGLSNALKGHQAYNN
jgi:hypothetical protein